MTARQRQLLKIIDTFKEENGRPPRRYEMANKMGVSQEYIRQITNALIEKGILKMIELKIPKEKIVHKWVPKKVIKNKILKVYDI
jgi:Mn-dependent DtxR family transcriptional regulator